MKRSPWYARYPGDYLRDTAHLSLMENGAYTLLLDHYYSTGPLLVDKDGLYRVCKNTLTARYQYWRDNEDGDLGSQLNLSSQAYHSLETEDTVQISDTQVIGSKIINETRFQYNRDNSIQSPSDTNPAVNVFGNFTGGGNGSGNYNDLQNNYEVQNYTSLIHSNHVFKFGVRLRATGETDYSTSGFNGTFTFSALTGQPNLTNCLGQLSPCPVSLAFALNQIQHPRTTAARLPMRRS